MGLPGSGIQWRISHNLSKSANIGSNTARLGVLQIPCKSQICTGFFVLQ